MWMWLAAALWGAQATPVVRWGVPTWEDSPSVAVSSARAAVDEGRWDDAVRELRALAQASGDPALIGWWAVALVESEAPRQAEAVLAEALTRHPNDVDLHLWMGRVLAEIGRGSEALDRVRTVLQEGTAWQRTHASWVASVVEEDRGSRSSAIARMRDAERWAEASGDAALLASCRARRRAVEGRGPVEDVVGRVSDALSRGEAGQARGYLSPGETGGRLEKARQKIAQAMVSRHEGRPDEGLALLEEAWALASDAGGVRERLLADLERGRALSARGRGDEALVVWGEAIASAARTSLRVREVELRVEQATLWIRRGELDRAEEALLTLDARAREVERQELSARRQEVQALLRAAQGRGDEALRGWAAAVDIWDALDKPVEVARVILEEERWRSRADRGTLSDRQVSRLKRAGLRAPQAERVAARGLGLADAARWPEAIAALERAHELAKSAGDAGLIGRVSSWREQAAQWRGGAPDGLADRLRAAEQGRGWYRRGREAYEAGRFEDAARSMEAAVEALTRAEDQEALRQARDAWWMARWNHALGLPPEEAEASLDSLHQEAESRGWSQRAARALATRAVLASQAGRPDGALLKEASTAAKKAGLTDLARQCAVERVRLLPPLVAAELARRLDGERSDSLGPRALVDAAFVAWRSGDSDLARALLTEADGRTAGAAKADADRLLRELGRAHIASERDVD